MIVARTRQELDSVVAAARAATGGAVGFVPTMGSLHEGHLSLVRESRRHCAITVASIFVNPTQFAPGEDFEAYPRDEQRDAAMLESVGCDILFLPGPGVIYPEGFATEVLADRSLTGCLCGASRGHSHFDGVTTVVARLFGLVRPDRAIFGEKDWQQLLVVSRMAADLFPSIEIVGCPTAREADGLAMSSRNAYLTADQRQRAAAIPTALRAIGDSELPYHDRLESARRTLTAAGLDVEYLEIRDASSLAPPVESEEDADRQPARRRARVFIAARLGTTRLIDNFPLDRATASDSDSQKPADGAATATVAASTT